VNFKLNVTAPGRPGREATVTGGPAGPGPGGVPAAVAVAGPGLAAGPHRAPGPASSLSLSPPADSDPMITITA
jgi:hypothetical protein